MEEILASIRRIISEDDAPAAPAAAAPPPAAPAPAPAPAAAAPPPAPPPPPPEPDEPFDEEEVLELNEPAPALHETHGDIDVFEKAAAPVVETPAPEVERAPLEPSYADPPFDEETPDLPPAGGGLVSGRAASVAASHFGALAQSVAMPAHGRTLEDVVSEMLRPLLKDWLDQYLPAMVEQAVRDEVERISRRRVY